MPESMETFDLVVIGSGAGGLSAAVTAAHRGLRVVVLEKTEVLGGTTAWSGGWIFAPRNAVARRAGINEEIDAPRRYLTAVTGNYARPEKIEAFLEAAPEMVSFFEENTALTFDGGLVIPDTYGHQPGAGTGGRSVIAQPYDARGLGEAVKLLRLPLPETTFKGMTIQSGADLKAFMTMTRDVKSFAHVTKRVTKHFRDLALHGRGMELRNGAALVGRLMRSALDKGVDLRVRQQITGLEREGDRVTGVRLADGSVILGTHGVVLATGGYGHDSQRRHDSFRRDDEHLSLAVPSATGDGLRLGEAVGGLVDLSVKSAAAQCPVSHVTWADGSTGVFPHIIDRGKPGLIGVMANGKRFCNEGLGYHDYVDALLEALPEGQPAKSWMICDHRFLRRFGLGIVRPAPVPYHGWIKRGYLKTGATPAELARACGIDPAGLEQTLAHWNEHARQGEDPEFHRGTTAYMRLQGDPEQKPNPNVAPIEAAPYYAVEVVPGSFGTFAGLSTDVHARVLDAEGHVIPGLYAAGTDAASVFGGFYPAGGINLGPALTFGFIAGRHAASEAAAA
ncbi:FAD-dependent oxidoreductase [Pseudooceanicola sp. CBS1P-1]|uniref:FAD-dependent oxidoreductase n=1 Tax=Pseudooceanicola albus TaxID=2692189 RepID=A0A6L7G481_9RHOB|nr:MULTISPECIES: FAD-dependent oxidoreductase [Pseudooceanicola]MBT9385676.1 FAD-dependent oxidoreductase [Pseudooceanicola endophyticus]MXN18915.1 FAD-dependent oxidoreductase [Pseudooceanicola albus]